MIALLVLMACGEGGTVMPSHRHGQDSASDDPVSHPISQLLVNEFMASNRHTIQDDQGDWPDWIELFNASDEAIDLAGWTLTDDVDRPGVHSLDGLSVSPGGYLLLWADGDPDAGTRHLDFHLDISGDGIVLIDPHGDTADALGFGPQATDVSNMRQTDGDARWVLTATPTPGASNGDAR